MGNLTSMSSLNEIVSTLVALEQHGVAAGDFKYIRQYRDVARMVADSITETRKLMDTIHRPPVHKAIEAVKELKSYEILAALAQSTLPEEVAVAAAGRVPFQDELYHIARITPYEAVARAVFANMTPETLRRYIYATEGASARWVPVAKQVLSVRGLSVSEL